MVEREEDVDVISRNFNEVERQELVFHYVNLAAAQNDTESQRNVGDFYYYNRSGISDDFLEKACAYDYMEQAFDFYSKAASGRPKDLRISSKLIKSFVPYLSEKACIISRNLRLSAKVFESDVYICVSWMAHHGIGTTKNYSIARNM